MRKAALIAGAVQLLYGLFTAVPQMFGTSFFSAPGQTAFRTSTVIGCLTLVIFFFGILTVPRPNIGGAVRIVSVLAAGTMTIENLSSAFGTIRGAASYISDTSLWKFHPLRLFGYVLSSTLPTLCEISLVVFLLAVFANTLRPQSLIPNVQDQTDFLRLASFTVSAVGVVALVGTIVSWVVAPKSFTPSAFRMLLRFATLASFIVFFFVFGRNQHQSPNS